MLHTSSKPRVSCPYSLRVLLGQGGTCYGPFVLICLEPEVGIMGGEGGGQSYQLIPAAFMHCIGASNYSVTPTLCHVIGQKMSSKYSNSTNVVQKSSPGTPVS